MDKEMMYILNSKIISWWGIFTAGLIGVDFKWFDSVIMDSLSVNAFFTNLYMGLFGIYYAMRIYWFWIDKALNRREREKQLNKED